MDMLAYVAKLMADQSYGQLSNSGYEPAGVHNQGPVIVQSVLAQ